MIGVCAERLYWRISLAVSKPSMSGMLTSSRIAANSLFRISFSASAPERAQTSSWPRSSSTVWKTRSFSGRSSTMRMLARSTVVVPRSSNSELSGTASLSAPRAGASGRPAWRGSSAMAGEHSHRVAAMTLGSSTTFIDVLLRSLQGCGARNYGEQARGESSFDTFRFAPVGQRLVVFTARESCLARRDFVRSPPQRSGAGPRTCRIMGAC